MRAVAVLLACVACGGGSKSPPPASSAPSLVEASSGPDDVVVAQVNGRPVWGACVAAQVARGAKDRRIALDECIAFELMAQEAERRGLATDPEVAEATREALVDRLVAVDFEARYRSPDDLRETIDKAIAKRRITFDMPELRNSSYARVVVDAKAPPEQDARARAVAERLAAELADKTGLFPLDLKEVADRLRTETGMTIEYADYRPSHREGVVPAYGDALFSIPEVGRIAPPVRTEWGWDVILLTDLTPAKLYTRDEVAATAFPELRRQQFQIWVNGIIKSRGVKIRVDEKQLEAAW